MAIIEKLDGLGLRSLAPPLLWLIERTGGMARAFDNADEHAERLLLQHIERCSSLTQDDARVLLMQACVGLPAFRYRVGSASGPEVWHPLKESLEQFEARQGGVLFWLDVELHPPIPETLEWLRSWGF